MPKMSKGRDTEQHAFRGSVCSLKMCMPKMPKGRDTELHAFRGMTSVDRAAAVGADGQTWLV